jgi:starch-binding outer membrane protein, SusD/RagB family
MRPIRFASAVLALIAFPACGELTVPDFNNTSIDDLRNNPTPAKIAQAAQGLLVGTRLMMGPQNGYISLLGIIGRESYNFDAADPRFITEMLIGPLDGGSPAFGGNLFGAPYLNIRNANTLLDAVGETPGMSAEDMDAVRGFAKTIQALDYLLVINTRDEFGAPIASGGDPRDPPAPIASKAEVFAHIVQLLDEAKTHLQAAGSTFPFTMSPGFADFDTPATFLEFNRAIKARVDVYMGNYGAALTSLSESFLDTSAPLDFGAYHTYTTGSGDLQNLLFDPTGRAILAHPSIVTDAQQRPGGGADLRLTTKVVSRAEGPRTVQGITTDVVFSIYNSNTAPIPVITNEELILLRAEARLFTNDIPGAIQDLNLIRTTAGGLGNYAGPSTEAAVLDELLYNRRYSLLFQGGHRWIDARRFGRLATLPLAVAGHTVQPRFPFPESECLARVPAPTEGCG